MRSQAGWSQNAFKKVAVSEKKALFRKIAEEKKQLVVKDDEDRFRQLIALRLEKDEKLYCVLAAKQALRTDQAVLLNFIFEKETFFMQTTVGFEKDIPWLDITADLFQLQRRQNARLDLPKEYGASVNLVEQNGTLIFLEGQVRDISAGGLKIFLAATTPVIAVEDNISLFLKLGQRRPMDFRTNVRFVAAFQDGQMFGVQFLDRGNVMENKLLSIMMDLQRELYVRYGGR